MSKVVLQITGMLSTKFGSFEKYLLEITRQCAEGGYRSVIQYEAEPNSREYRTALENAGAIVIVEPRPHTAYQASRSLFRIISQTRPEVVQTHFFPRRYLPLASNISRLFGVQRRVCMVHNAMASKNALANKVAYSGFDYILGVSDAVTEQLRIKGVSGDNVRTHYLGLVFTDRFSQRQREVLRKSLGIPDDAVVFGTIAFAAPFKGVDVLLEAFSTFVSAQPAAHLVQLGIDPSDSAFAKKFSNISNVHWLGIRDNAYSFLPALDVYVQPSRFGEGLPLSIMEAMAMERPVVATRVAGNSEAVVHGTTGLLVEPQNVESLAKGMWEMGYALGPDGRRQMGEAGGMRFREMFDGQRSVKALVELYGIGNGSAD